MTIARSAARGTVGRDSSAWTAPMPAMTRSTTSEYILVSVAKYTANGEEASTASAAMASNRPKPRRTTHHMSGSARTPKSPDSARTARPSRPKTPIQRCRR